MLYANKLSADLLELAKTAIDAASYAGEDVRFSVEYEALESELGKAQAMHERKATDWQKVRECSERLLRTQSKDLRVSIWLAWALYERESFQGLVAGLGLVRYLCEHHWVDIYPAKARTRCAAFNWLVPRLDKVLNGDIAIGDQLPLFRSLHDHLQALDATCTSHLRHDAPLLLPVSRRLEGMLQRASDARPQEGAVSAAIAQVKQAVTQVFNPDALIENEKDARKALRAQQDNARPLCEWWLKQKATDVRALRLNRTLSWLAVEALPERSADHTTLLQGLPADKLSACRERYEKGAYADLLVELEASLTQCLFWFDGQRMAWECLEQLAAEAAMREVEIHLAQLIQRLPGIVELRFRDGTPFADPLTRTWITTHVMPHLASAAQPCLGEAADSQPAWELALQQGLAVLRSDGLKAAVHGIKQGLQCVQGGRPRFFWQFTLARLCFMAGKHELARTQLETLDQTLHDAGLHTWEPDLALQVLQLLHECCEALPQSHVMRERKEEIYRRLCRLDIDVALQ